MSATLLPNAKQQFFDALGNPLAGGSVAFYVPGTTTPKNTWQDSGQTILNTNPVILNAAGEALIYGDGAYRQVVKDALGNLIWDQLTQDTVDAAGISAAMAPVVGASTTEAALSLIQYLDSASGSVARSVTSRLGDTISVLDFGADSTGVNDSTTAIQAALNAVASGTGSKLYFPAGTYTLTSNVAVTLANNAAVTVMGAGRETTKLVWSNAGGGLTFNFVNNGNWAMQPGNLLTVADMSFVTSVNNGGSAITVNGNTATGEPPAATTFRSLTFRGSSPTSTAQWSIGLNLVALGTVSLWDISIFGASLLAQTAVGVQVAGNNTRTVTQFVMNGVNATYLNVGVNVGDYVQGVMLTGCNLSWVNIGVQFLASAGLQNQCSVVNTQIQGFQYCIAIQDCDDNQIVGNTLFIGDNFAGTGTHYSGGGVGVQLTNSGRTQILGNSFVGAVQAADAGIVIGNPAGQPLSFMTSTIDGNSFTSLNEAIALQASTSNIVIGNTNGYSQSVNVRIGDAGANNVKQPTVFSTGATPTFVGGAATETFTVTVPTFYFPGAPSSAFGVELNPGAEEYLVWYNQSASSATSLQFMVARRDGTNITAGPKSFGIVAFT